MVYVDPFFHYHKPLEGFPYIVDNQLSQNPGMAQNFIYDSAIIGSSMTVNFHTSDFGQILGKNTIKLSYSGALPRDDYNRLLELNPKLEQPYFLRTVYTEKDYYYSYICICNSNTC